MDFVVTVRSAHLAPSGPDPVVPQDFRVRSGEPVNAAQLAAALGDQVGMPRAHLVHAGAPLKAGHPCGQPPLVNGASLTLSPSGLADHGSASSKFVEGPAPFDVTVVSGPDCGQRTMLSRRPLTLGRSADCRLPIDDDALSRQHAAVTVTTDGVTVTDLESTNGITVDGVRAGATIAVDRSSRIVLGDTEIRLRRPVPNPRNLRPDGHGYLRFGPTPSTDRPDRPPHELRRPTAPTTEPPRSLPWITMVVPLPIAAVLAVAFGPQFLLFALLGPATMGATWWHDRRSRRRRTAAGTQDHERALAEHAAQLSGLLSVEAVHWEEQCPDAADTLDTVRTRSPRLWSRTPAGPAWLDLRLGTGQPPSRAVNLLDEQGRRQPLTHERAPVIVGLSRLDCLAICGPAPHRTRVLRHLLGQLLAGHSPADLAVVVLSGTDIEHAQHDWRWLAWAPHVEVVATAERAGEAVHAHRSAQRSVVLVDLNTAADDTATHQTAADETVADETAADVASTSMHALAGLQGVHLVTTDPSGALPRTGRGATLLLDASGHTLTVEDDEVVSLRADGVGRWWGERLGRALAPLRPEVPVHRSVATTPWSALGVEPPAPHAPSVALADHVLARWSGLRAGGQAAATALVGTSADGPWTIDLDTDGPHLLIGGTTGSGKSEVLRALACGLAATSSPDEVTFLLIDYKGGSTFTHTARLPHTVGVVSDLDPQLADRALRSLRAEVHRRERLFAAAGVSDLADYAKGPADEPLPRLVVILDEFRVLADEHPAFLSGLVRLASVGRSMGIHLILATQRPAGAITPDIQANVNLRVALRMRDAHDSDQVIGSPAAADIDPRSPGRGLARHGDGSLTEFRALHVSGSTPRPSSGLRVEPLKPASARSDRPEDQHPGDISLPSDEQLIVDVIALAASASGRPLPRLPWLPPLPELLAADALPPATRLGSIPVGLVDLPDNQEQTALSWSPGDPLWRVVGGRRSGRSTTLVTVVTQATQRLSTDEVEVYAVGSAAALAPLSELPHCAAVVSVDEPGRLNRLLRRLRSEVEARRAGGRHPVALVVIDDWDHALALERPWASELEQVVRDVVTTDGMALVAAGGRALATTRVVAGGELVCLGGLEAGDLLLMGIRSSRSAAPWPPGRGVRVADQAEVQVALPEPDPVPLRRSRRRPAPVLDLPTRVRLVDVTGAGPPTVGDNLVLGVADDPPVAWWDATRSGRTLLVTGPSGSGRTALLEALAAQCPDRARHVIRIGPRSVASSAADSSVVASSAADPSVADSSVADSSAAHSSVVASPVADPSVAHSSVVASPVADPSVAHSSAEGRVAHTVWVSDPNELANALATAQRPLLLADDIEGLGPDVGQALLGLLDQLAHHDALLAVSAGSHQLATAFRGLVPALAGRGHGVLLNPSGPHDASALGARLDVPATSCPGRGVLIGRGRAIEIQVPLVEEPVTSPSRR